jgi:hypothetical protein
MGEGGLAGQRTGETVAYATPIIFTETINRSTFVIRNIGPRWRDSKVRQRTDTLPTPRLAWRPRDARISFFTPTALAHDAIGAERYLFHKFHLHRCSE